MILSLIGPRGSGKSTLGRRLAGNLGLEYVSIDEQIARQAGRSIPELVSAGGWVKFRVLEESVLAEVVGTDGRLLDCGGGIVEVPANRKRLRDAGPVVWVDAPLEALIERTAGDADRPPLTEAADPVREIEVIVHRRDPLYRKTADFVVHNAGADIDSVCGEIIAWVSAASPPESPSS